jgi:hypothetical protein
MPSASPLTLAIPGNTPEDDLTLAITVKNISTASILLQTTSEEPPDRTGELRGRPACIRLASGSGSGPVEVAGKILWVRSDAADPDTWTIGLEFAEALSPGTRHALEAQMEIVHKDIKELWNQWDMLHGRQAAATPAVVRVLKPEVQPLVPPVQTPVRPETGSARGTYLVGFGVMAAGTGMQFLGEDYLRFSGLVLIIYGSIIVAGKSLWGMWQLRRGPQTD